MVSHCIYREIAPHQVFYQIVAELNRIRPSSIRIWAVHPECRNFERLSVFPHSHRSMFQPGQNDPFRTEHINDLFRPGGSTDVPIVWLKTKKGISNAPANHIGQMPGVSQFVQHLPSRRRNSDCGSRHNSFRQHFPRSFPLASLKWGTDYITRIIPCSRQYFTPMVWSPLGNRTFITSPPRVVKLVLVTTPRPKERC